MPTGKPEIENGYTPIANELLEALCQTRLSSYEWKVLMVIARATYGWQQKAAVIAKCEIARQTGLPANKVFLTVRRLKSRAMLTEKDGALQLQKYYSKWRLPSTDSVLVPKEYQSQIGTSAERVPKTSTDSVLLPPPLPPLILSPISVPLLKSNQKASGGVPEKSGPPAPQEWADDQQDIFTQLQKLQAEHSPWCRPSLQHRYCLADPLWWRTIEEWIDSTGLQIFFLDEIPKYLSHQRSQSKAAQHHNQRRGFRNWLAKEEYWRRKDAEKSQGRNR